MPKIEGWERLLAEAIEGACHCSFAWGLHDCPTFAFETRALLTAGEDVAALWRGRYTSALGGKRIMRKLGWSSLETMGHALLGDPLENILLAKRGDIVLADTGLGFGICCGAHAVGMAPSGLVSAPLTSCRLAWSL
jgi:hypothetical protein